jgi:hypothetical protein
MPYFIELTDGEYLNLETVQRIQLLNDGDCKVYFTSIEPEENSRVRRYDKDDADIIKNAMKFFNSRR